MNPWMLQALADSRCREMRRDGARHRDRVPGRAPAPAPAPAPALVPASAPVRAGAGRRRPQVRAQVGYALVEAGLRLLATAGPAQRG
jgi:hypothetical protein